MYDISRSSLQLLLIFLVVDAFVDLVSASPIDHGVLKWQTGDILDEVPEGCRTTCGPINIILTKCGNTSCLCTAPNFMALKICMDCVVDYGTGTPAYEDLRSQGQMVLDNFGSDCEQQGARLSQLLLNPTPAPGPPGTGTVIEITTFTTRTDGASSTGTGGPRGSGFQALVLEVAQCLGYPCL